MLKLAVESIKNLTTVSTVLPSITRNHYRQIDY